jgi:DNA polymerase-3 subunit delta
MVYLLLNCDEFLAAERITALKAGLGEPEMASLNTHELDGERTSVSEVLGQASMMPFLAERRMVIVRGMLTYLDHRLAASKTTEGAAYTEAAQLLDGLARMPETCDLVLIDNNVDRRRALWRGFALPKTEKQPERKVLGLEAFVKNKQVVLEELAAPDARALPGWIQARARQRNILIDGRAVQMLADFVGPQLRQLNNELVKLALYAGDRPINISDVKLLVSDVNEALIWDLTDALSQRNGRNAMTALMELRRSDANPFQLLTMIARQYRIMIKVKEAMLHRPGDEYAIAEQMGEKPYPVKKAMVQATKYSMQELERVMELLLTADHAMKTGADVDTEIDLLIAELT